MTARSPDRLSAPPAAYFDEVSNDPLEEQRLAACEAEAAPYFAAFEAKKAERRRVIQRKCDDLDTRPVVISTFNWGFRRLVENWAASCDRHGIDCRSCTLMFPTDSQADAFARDLGFQTFFDGESYGTLPTEACKAFGDANFRRCLFAKVAVTQDVLAAGVDVLRQDVDIVWLRDPRPYLTRQMNSDQLDFLFMDDGLNPFHRPLHFNSGFVCIRNNAFSRYAWNLIFSHYPRILHYGSEQRVINIVMSFLNEQGLRCGRLEDRVFVNGHVISEVLDKGAPFPESSSVIHFSWTKNLESKLMHLKQFGHWYV